MEHLFYDTSVVCSHIVQFKRLFILLYLKFFTALSCCVVFPSMADDLNNNEWIKYNSEDGIIGFERNVMHSEYLESRAEMTLNVPVEVVLEILKDISSYPQWMYKCKEAVQIYSIGEDSNILYFVQETFLGSQDRDVIINAKSLSDWHKGKYVITLQSIDTPPHQLSIKAKLDDGRQRMIELNGKWDLSIIDRNHTKVIYTIFANPGGFAPSFFVNSLIRKVSFLSLKGLVQMAKVSRYSESAKYSTAKDKIDTVWKSNNSD